ncbi:MAG: MG2 domain-containing protein [Brevinema sp.]
MMQSLSKFFKTLSIKQRYLILSLLSLLSTSLAIFFIFVFIPKQNDLSKTFDEAVLQYLPREISFSLDKELISFASFDDAVDQWQEKLAISFDPPLQGVFRPNGRREISFLLDTALSHDVQISFNSNILNLAKLSINQQQVTNTPFILKSNPPKITQVWRTNDSLKTPLFILSDQPIKLQELKKAITITEGKEPLTFSLHYNVFTNTYQNLSVETNYTQFQLFLPSLQPNKTYHVTIDQTLFSNQGNFDYSFTTYDIPKWQELSTKPYPNDDPLEEFTVAKPLWVLHNNMIDTKKGSVKITVTPEVSNIQHKINPTGICITADFYPDVEYKIDIDPKGMKDIFGQKINQSFSKKILFKNEKPNMTYAKDIMIIDKRNPLIPIQSINMTNIRVTYQLIKSDYYTALALLGKDIPVVTYHTNITLSNVEPNKYQWHYFDASAITTNQSALLNIKFYDPKESQPKEFIKTFFTEHVLSAHISENALLFYTHHINTQKPIEDMNILVWDRVRGSFQDLGQTTADGTLYVPNPKLPDVVLQQPIFIGIVDSDEGDLSYAGIGNTIFNTLDRKSFFSSAQLLYGNIYHSSKPKSVLFTDRELYLPGETVYFQIIARVRENNKLTSINPLLAQPVTIKISGPNNKILTNFTQSWNKFGSISASFVLPNNAESGYYSIHINNQLLKFSEYKGFEVRPFEPQKSELLMIQQTNQYLYHETFSAQIRPQFLFKQAIHAPISYQLSATPTTYHSKLFPNHTFNNITDISRTFASKKINNNILLRNKKLPSLKTGTVSINHKLIPKFAYNARLSLNTSMILDHFLPITNAQHDLFVYFPIQLGIKMDQTNLNNLDEVTFDFVAISSLKEVVQSNIPVKLNIFKNQKTSLGIFSFLTNYIPELASFKKRVFHDELELGHTKYTFTPSEEGEYTVQLSLKQFGFWTSSSLAFTINKNINTSNLLYMTANKTAFVAGDRACIEIKNPFPKGRLVLTVEQDSLREFYIFETTNKTIKHFIPITSEDEPGVNISAVLISLPLYYQMSEENDFGDMAVGQLSLPIEPINKKLTVQIDNLKEHYLPGEKVSFDISAYSKSLQIDGQATVIIRDKAVLFGAPLPNLLDYFYQPSPFGFSAWSSGRMIYDLNHLTNKIQEHQAVPLFRQASSLANSASPAVFQEQMKISLRSNIVYTPYYQSEIPLYRNKKSQISFTLPDNISGFDVTVIVYNKDQLFGQTNTNFSTSKPFITEPIIPNFVRSDDIVNWGVYAHNLTSMSLNATLLMSNNYSKISTNINLTQHSSMPVLIQSKILDDTNSIWHIQGIANEYEDGFVKKVPVVPFYPSKINSYVGLLEANQTNLSIPINQQNNMIEQHLMIQMSSSPLLAVSDLLYQTITNKSMYLEHILDKILVITGNEDILDIYTSFDKLELQNIVQSSLDQIILYSSDTLLHPYPIDAKIPYVEDPALILKAYEALLNAQDHTYKINPNLYTQLTKKIQAYAQNKFLGNSNKNNFYRIFAMKLLASQNLLDQIMFESSYESFDKTLDTQILVLETMKLLGMSTRTIALQISKVMQEITSKALVLNIDSVSPIAVQGLLRFFSKEIDMMKTLESIVTHTTDNLRNYLFFEKNYPQDPNSTLKVQIDQQQTILNKDKNDITYDISTNQQTVNLQLSTTNDSLYYLVRYEQLFDTPFDVGNAYTVTKTITDSNNNIILNQDLLTGQTYTVTLKIQANNISQSWVEIIDPVYAGIVIEPRNNMMLSPQGDNLHLFTKLNKETIIRYRFQAKFTGTWTAPPLLIQNVQNPMINALISQPSISIK